MICVEKFRQSFASLLKAQFRIVSDIVRMAHERINCRERIPLSPRQHHEAIVEILRSRPRNMATHAVGGRQLKRMFLHCGVHYERPARSFPANARKSNPVLRSFEIVGRFSGRRSPASRWPSGSPVRLARRVRYPARVLGLTCLINGSPRSNQSLARATSNCISSGIRRRSRRSLNVRLEHLESSKIFQRQIDAILLANRPRHPARSSPIAAPCKCSPRAADAPRRCNRRDRERVSHGIRRIFAIPQAGRQRSRTAKSSGPSEMRSTDR